MKKVLGIIAMAIMVSVGRVYADEGMWLPMFVERLNYVDMQKMGLQLTPEELYRASAAMPCRVASSAQVKS